MTQHYYSLLALVALTACTGDMTHAAPPKRPFATVSQGRSFSGAAFSRGRMSTPDRSKRSPILSDVAYAIAPQSAMDGAMAWLVRDPSSSDPLLVVVPKEGVTDAAYVVARHLMLRDVQSLPTVRSRRVVKIYRDQRVQIEEGGTSRTAYTRLSVSNVTTTIAPEMLRRHETGRIIHVTGLGSARVVFEPTRNIVTPE